MPVRATRYKSFGGGGAGVVGNVVVGPDFGEGSDDNTWTVNPTFDIDQINPTFPAFSTVTTAFDIDAVNPTFPAFSTVTTTFDLDAVNIGDLAVGTATTTFDIDQVNLGDLSVGTVTASFAGTITAAPFWQTEAHAAATATGFTLTCDKPPGTVEGELLVAFVGVKATITALPDTPSGWTEEVSARAEVVVGGQVVLRGALFWKIAGASEPANYTFTVPDTAVDPETFTVEIHRIQGAHATTPIDSVQSASLQASALDPDPDAPDVTTVASNCLVIRWTCHDHLTLTQTHTPAASQVERTDFQSINSTTTQRIGSCSQTRIYATPGATGAVAFDCTETVATNAVMISVGIAPGSISFP